MPTRSTVGPNFSARKVDHPKSLRLVIGASMLVLSAWAFGAIAEDVVTGDPLVLLDARLSSWFDAHSTPGWTHVMQFLTALGSFPVVFGVSLALAAYFWWRQWWSWISMLVLTVGGSEILSVLLKHAFHRTRPHFTHPMVTLTSFSFPSGHTMAATTLYGFLAVWVLVNVQSWRLRAAAIGGAALLIVMVAISRIYLGAHFLTDVAAAIAAGVAWLALSVTALGAHRRFKPFNAA
jgi:membrane-associated phospholipid phosphatase